MRIGRARLVTASLGCLVLLAAGCSGGNGTKSKLESKGQTATGAMKDGGTLTFGQTAGVPQLDPNTIGSGAQTQLQTLLWNGLTTWSSDNLSVKPDLAQSWEHSADFLHWTFHLHPGVTYHNGRAFTAADAVLNINRVLDPKVAAQVGAKLTMISKATATDPNTLTIDLKSPNPQLPTTLIDVKMSDVGDIANVNKDANGTGPYKLKAFVPNQSVDVVRNDKYWGPKPHFAEIKIVKYGDETAAETALKSGSVDVLASVPPNSVGSLSAGRQLLAATQPGSAAAWEMDTTAPPFNNVKVRQALSYALDRKSMMKAAYADQGAPNFENVIVNPNNKFYDGSLPKYNYDLNKAKKLFAEAGIKPGTTFTFWTTAGAYPEWTTMGEIFQQSMKKIGMNIKIESNEVATWSQKFYPKPKSYPGLIAANYLSFPVLPASYSLVWFSSNGTCECNWKPPAAYDEAAASLDQTDDPAKVQAAAATMQKILNQESPILVIGNTSFLDIVSPKLRGAWMQSEGTLHLETAGFAQ